MCTHRKHTRTHIHSHTLTHTHTHTHIHTHTHTQTVQAEFEIKIRSCMAKWPNTLMFEWPLSYYDWQILLYCN